VLNYGGFNWKGFDYSRIQSKVRIIVWCHNFCTFENLSLFSKESRFAKLITVGREQMDLYRDHPAYEKSDYIFNCVPFPQRYKERLLQKPFSKRDHNVVYLASLVPAKSFHVLAEVWPYVLKCIPDANLYVIGSGKTYFKDAKLGEYGIASQEYEKVFMSPLLDENGECLTSVHFLGNLGEEKYDYLLNSKVGVPNPTGATETFCISAVEMQYLGCSVTAMSAPGYYDTFFNGIITKRSKKSFARTLIKLLKSEKPVGPYSETVERLQANFSIDSVAQEWENLLNGDIKKHIHPVCPISNKRYRLKWLKELRRKCGLHSFFPPIEFFLEKRDSLNNIIRRF
jgi:glycosyltransferase involved in cell wall biosynthesis